MMILLLIKRWGCISMPKDELKELEEKINLLKEEKARKEANKPITKAELANLFKDLIASKPASEHVPPTLPKFEQLDMRVPEPPEHMKAKNKFVGQIDKKIAALEVLKHLKIERIFAYGAIGGVFLVLISSTFGIFPASIVTGGLIIPAALHVNKVNVEIKRLQSEYSIK